MIPSPKAEARPTEVRVAIESEEVAIRMPAGPTDLVGKAAGEEEEPSAASEFQPLNSGSSNPRLLSWVSSEGDEGSYVPRSSSSSSGSGGGGGAQCNAAAAAVLDGKAGSDAKRRHVTSTLSRGQVCDLVDRSKGKDNHQLEIGG